MTDTTSDGSSRTDTDADASITDRLCSLIWPLLVVAEYTEQRIHKLDCRFKLAALISLGVLIVAADPVAAQEFCDDPAGQLLISIEMMLLNYGTMLLFLAFLIGVAMWALTPIFAGQSAIGLGMILLSFGAAIAFVVGTQFFGMTFEIAGAGGESCSTVLE